MNLINCTCIKEAPKRNYAYIYFSLSQRKGARERIKHLYYRCELLSDLSEPPSMKEGWMRAVGVSEGTWGVELRMVYAREAERW